MHVVQKDVHLAPTKRRHRQTPKWPKNIEEKVVGEESEEVVDLKISVVDSVLIC